MIRLANTPTKFMVDWVSLRMMLPDTSISGCLRVLLQTIGHKGAVRLEVEDMEIAGLGVSL